MNNFTIPTAPVIGQAKTATEGAGTYPKKVLTTSETAEYLGLTKSYLYKLTMSRQIPHYKPMGKMIYFDLKEVEDWARRNRVATETELTDQANSQMRKGGAI